MQAYRDEWEQKRIDTIAEFKQQAIARKQGAEEKLVQVNEMTTEIMGLIRDGQKEQCLERVRALLWNEETNQNGLLTGVESEYMGEDGTLSEEKLNMFCERSRDACQLRIDEMDEAMMGDWEAGLETMLDMPFAEVDALICQYVLGQDHIRSPFQKLEDTIEYLEEKYEANKKKIGALPRPRKEGRGEDAQPNQEDLVKLQEAVRALKAEWFPNGTGEEDGSGAVNVDAGHTDGAATASAVPEEEKKAE